MAAPDKSPTPREALAAPVNYASVPTHKPFPIWEWILRLGVRIYVVPADGSEPSKLIANRGWKPEFSPDGKWIAYFTLTEYEDSTASFGLGQIFIISSEGGQPRQIAPDFPAARYPIWAPDSAPIFRCARGWREGLVDRAHRWRRAIANPCHGISKPRADSGGATRRTGETQCSSPAPRIGNCTCGRSPSPRLRCRRWARPAV